MPGQTRHAVTAPSTTLEPRIYGVSQIVVSDLVKSFNGNNAVEHVCFTVEAGEFLVLLGPSGCGKSTTLRLIAGLEEPTAGTVSIAGRDVTRASPSERQIAMVFQSYAVFPHLDVADNITFGLKVRGVGRAERDQRLQKVAELVGLTPYLARKPAQLSGGQRQRVALARAIISQRPVCLMDEPLSNLDAKLRHEMRVEIRELQQRLGITMVYVTHDQVEAMTMADRIILMKDGRIEQLGTPEKLYAHPATIFAARFLGLPPMNIFATPHGAGKLGVRAEHLRLVPPSTGRLNGEVAAVEFLGADTLVSVTVAADTLVARLSGAAHFRRGQTVGLTWADSDEHDFDATSGRRLATRLLETA
jgi:sn-glycerol 3-phosphate transport system ATP-binding protein